MDISSASVSNKEMNDYLQLTVLLQDKPLNAGLNLFPGSSKTLLAKKYIPPAT